MTKHTLIKRLTLARINENDKIETGKAVDVARIGFHVTSAVKEESPHGVYPRFIGEFTGSSLISGESFRAGTAVLPAILSAEIEGKKGDGAYNVTGVYDLHQDAAGQLFVRTVIPAAARSVLELLHAAEGAPDADSDAATQPPPAKGHKAA